MSDLKHMILAGLKAGLAHLAMSREEESQNSGKDTFICYAMFFAVRDGVCSDVDADQARKYIMKMLGGHLTVLEYLRYKLAIDKTLLTTKNVQEFRKRWLESMIAEFS